MIVNDIGGSVDGSIGGPGGWTPHMKGGGCSSKILNLTPTGDRSGHGPSFFDP